MRAYADEIRGRDQSVAEKQRGGSEDDHDQDERRKRIGELPRHQHLRLGEVLREILRGAEQFSLPATTSASASIRLSGVFRSALP
jgi:hypothetical protein